MMPFGQSSSHSSGSFGAFGASSSPVFGTTMSAFGASSAPAFGGPHPPDTTFDQKPNFGAFWSNPGQTSPFGSMSQSQPAFGSNMFGTLAPFDGSQSAFGTASTLPSTAFGTPPVGATRWQAFGGRSTTFGDSRTPVFGSSSFSYATPTTSTPAFGYSSSPSFSFPSPHAFGQSNATFGATSPLLKSSPFGAQATMPTSGNTGFWNSAFGGQRGGSRVTKYMTTLAPDSLYNGNTTMVELMSISAMPVYINKSHEELRYEDYQLGDKGGLTPAGASAFGTSTTQSGPLNPESVFAQTSSSHFNASTSPSIFSPHTPFTSTGFGISSSPFSSSSPPFWPSSTANPFTPLSSSPSFFGQSSPPSLISTPATSSFTFPDPSSNSTFNFTPTSSVAQTGGAFGQTSTSFWPTQTPFGQTNMLSTPSTGLFTPTSSFPPSSPSPSPSVFGQTPAPSPSSSQATFAIPFSAPPSTYNSGLQTGGAFGQPCTLFGQNIFNTPSTGIGSWSSSAAIPTSNPICFSQPAFVDKDLDKDTEMDDWVFC